MNLIDRVISKFGPEDNEQYAFIQYLDTLAAPYGIVYTSIPNATWTKSIEQRTRNTLLGLRPGLSDVMVVYPGHWIVFVEMKQTGKSVVSEAQKNWIEILNTIPNVEAHVAKGAEVARAIIEELLANGKTTVPIPQDVQDALEDRNEF